MNEHLEHLASSLQQVTGYIYPNEIELQWGLLVVIYPYVTGLVAGAFILASLEKVFNVKEVQPTYRLAMLTALAFLIVAPLPSSPIPRTFTNPVSFFISPACCSSSGPISPSSPRASISARFTIW